ncbi:MAG: hypothetical protein AAGK78_03055, partial [Planctomycetota bacterium]
AADFERNTAVVAELLDEESKRFTATADQTAREQAEATLARFDQRVADLNLPRDNAASLMAVCVFVLKDALDGGELTPEHAPALQELMEREFARHKAPLNFDDASLTGVYVSFAMAAERLARERTAYAAEANEAEAKRDQPGLSDLEKSKARLAASYANANRSMTETGMRMMLKSLLNPLDPKSLVFNEDGTVSVKKP